MTITSVGYDGTVDEVQWASLSEELGAAYSVKGPDDWKVATVVGQDRTVSIAAGVGYGRGVQDTLSGTPPTIQLPVVASGSRWDTVVARRDWQPPGGATTLMALTGTAAQAVAASRLINPGVADDQLLALVQVTAGAQLPTAVIDLRTWSSKVVTASSLLALPNAPLGKEVVVAGVRYRRELDGTATLVWVLADPPTPYTASGSIVTTPAANGTINIPYGVTFAAPVWAVANSGSALITVVTNVGAPTNCQVTLTNPAGNVITSGLRRVNWSATGLLA